MKAAAAILAANQRRQTRRNSIARLQPHEAQARVLSEAARFNVLAMGRRWGKTVLGEDLMLDPMLAGYPVGWFAPTYKIFNPAWDEIRRTLAPLTVRSNRNEHIIELSTGGVVEGWSLEDEDAGRSRKYKRVIIDEAARAPRLQTQWEGSIRPTLADYIGDAWFLSSTWGRNYFYHLWLRGQDPEQSDYASWQMPTSTNPYIDPKEIEAARNDLPAVVFAQEYEAAFSDDAGLVFRNVRAQAYPRETYQHEQGHKHSGGLDWAQTIDFTVLATIDHETKHVAPLERFNQIAWEIQYSRVRSGCNDNGISYLLAELNSIGSPNLEALQRMGLPVFGFTTTNETKAEIVQALALAFERKEIWIPDDPVLIGELEAFQAERLPSGRWKYGAPEGMHDDCVIALALAWWALVSQPIAQSFENPFF